MPANKVEGISLAQYLLQLASVVKSHAPCAWVRAEIVKIQQQGGHYYLQLTDQNEHGAQSANIRGVIWRSNASALLKKYSEGTQGAELSEHTRVLIKVVAVVHPVYGLSLEVQDIDPSFTLGDVARKIAEILAQLKSDEIINNNRSLTPPIEFTRVAVVAPDNAAGLQDFKSTANILHERGICRFEYFTARFQGADARASVLDALRAVMRKHIRDVPYDAVCLIRGGGAAMDLAYLNEYDIARAICLIPMPVFVGVGHSTDHIVLDDVANLSFDTPSKLVGHIAQTIIQNAKRARDDFTEISRAALVRTSSSTLRIRNALDDVLYNATQLLARAQATLVLWQERLGSDIKQSMSTARADMRSHALAVVSAMEKRCAHQQSAQRSHIDVIMSHARTRSRTQQQETRRL